MTVVDGPSDAHLVEVLTIGSQVASFSEGCSLEKGLAVCTIVGGVAGATTSTVLTVTSGASGLALVTNVPHGNGAERTGVAMFSALAVVVVGVVLGAAMV